MYDMNAFCRVHSLFSFGMNGYYRILRSLLMLSLSYTYSEIIKTAWKIIDNHFQHANATIELLSIEILSNVSADHVMFYLAYYIAIYYRNGSSFRKNKQQGKCFFLTVMYCFLLYLLTNQF